MKTLKPFQVTDFNNILDAINTYKSVMFQLSTGGGKSVILSHIIHKFATEENASILVFANRRKLIKQLVSHIESCGLECGVIAGALKKNLEARIRVVSVRTAVNFESDDSLNVDYVFIDEARYSRSNSYDLVLDRIKAINPNVKMLGLDATPYRLDGKTLEKHFNFLVKSVETTESLIQKGHLQRPKTIVTPFDIEDLTENVRSNVNEYVVSSLSKYMREENHILDTVNAYINHGENRPNICFCVDIEHSKAMEKAYASAGFSVARIDSTMSISHVEAVYADFEKGLINHLVTVEMAIDGVDLPLAGCITGLRPTMSIALYLQMIGRGARPDGIFDYFIILDCCGWSQMYGSMTRHRNWSLDPRVNPNTGLSSKSFIVRKGAIDNILDVSDYTGEVEEITEEELNNRFIDNIELAKESNLTIDERISKKIRYVLNKIIKNIKFEEVNEELLSKYDITFSEKRNEFVIKISSNETNSISLIKYNGTNISFDYEQSYYSDKDFTLMMLFSSIVNNIQNNPKSKEMLIEAIDISVALFNSKVDTDALEKMKEAIEISKVEEVIDNAVKTGIIEFGFDTWLDSYFRDCSPIKAIKFPNKKMMGSNEIVLVDKYGTENRRNQVKRDKIYEVIKYLMRTRKLKLEVESV